MRRYHRAGSSRAVGSSEAHTRLRRHAPESGLSEWSPDAGGVLHHIRPEDTDHPHVFAGQWERDDRALVWRHRDGPPPRRPRPVPRARVLERDGAVLADRAPRVTRAPRVARDEHARVSARRGTALRAEGDG